MRSGYVRVLRSPSDVDCVRDGGVLVIPVVDPGLAARLAHIIHDGSLRNRPVASRDGRAKPQGREAYSLQYVDRLSGESARLHAAVAACRLVAAGNGRLQQKRS